MGQACACKSLMQIRSLKYLSLQAAAGSFAVVKLRARAYSVIMQLVTSASAW